MMMLKGGTTRASSWVFRADVGTALAGFTKAKARVDDKVVTARKMTGADPIEPWGYMIYAARRQPKWAGLASPVSSSVES